MISVHISGVDETVRQMRALNDNVEDALDEGCTEAAETLRDAIAEKFGRYQPGWKHLKPDTIRKKGITLFLIKSNLRFPVF